MNGVTTRPRKVSRILALAAACGLAVLTLSGCIKVNADLAIDSDATGSGTLSLELQKQAAILMGMTDLDAFESGLTSGDLGGQGLGAFGTCETSETDEAFVYTCSFSGRDVHHGRRPLDPREGRQPDHLHDGERGRRDR